MGDDDHQQFDLEKLHNDEKLVREQFWDKLRKTLGRVPFMEDAVAFQIQKLE